MSLAPPPTTLSGSPSILHLPIGTGLVRFFDPTRGDWSAHRFYGPVTDMRFDHQPPPPHLDPTRSVWYAATSLRGAVAEAFGRTRILDRSSDRKVVIARVTGSIAMLDLVGVAARSIGVDQEIAATSDYKLCQAWARAIYDKWTGIQGIRWRARQSGSVCVVLNDRVTMSELSARTFNLDDSRIWPRIARAARDCHLSIV